VDDETATGTDLEVTNNPYNPHNRIYVNSNSRVLQGSYMENYPGAQSAYSFYKLPFRVPTYVGINIFKNNSANTLSVIGGEMNAAPDLTGFLVEGGLPESVTTNATSGSSSWSILAYDTNSIGPNFEDVPGYVFYSEDFVEIGTGIASNTEQFAYYFLQDLNRSDSKSFMFSLTGSPGATSHDFVGTTALFPTNKSPFNNFTVIDGGVGETFLQFYEIDPSYRKSDGTYYDVCIFYTCYGPSGATTMNKYGDVIVPKYFNYPSGLNAVGLGRPDLQSFASFYDPVPDNYEGAILGPSNATSTDSVCCLYSGSLYPYYYNHETNDVDEGQPPYFRFGLSDFSLNDCDFSLFSVYFLHVISTNPNPTSIAYN
jgi:hypothetical protein